jgi:Aromatic-ring-opening dioxygenase LigAB, LigA subunit
MSGEHYFFPPARAYPLNHCLYQLKSDAKFCGRYVADPEAAMEELALDAEAREALRTFERDRLIALGAHPYLVFMAGLRVRMESQPGSFEYF